MLLNLWKKTVEMLTGHGKTWADVLQVQASGEFYPLADAEKAFKATVYHSESLGDEVATDLAIVGDTWAMRWDRGWIWMEIPELLETTAKGSCPESFSTADETDEDGCRVPTYNKPVKELKTKKVK